MSRIHDAMRSLEHRAVVEKSSGSVLGNLVGALIGELADEVPDDPNMEAVRADLLGAARAWLSPAIGPQIDNHILWVAAFAVAGMLFVIPTAGEVPIIQAMLALGMGVGPAGALLMTLPPISLPSLAMLSRSFPPRILAMVGAAVVLFGLAGGALAIWLRF